jgi:hypothetical protein
MFYSGAVPIVVIGALLLVPNAFPQGHPGYFRRYKLGDHYSYELRTQTADDNETEVAVVEMNVQSENGAPYEQAHWVSFFQGESDLGYIAQSEPPFALSLDPRGFRRPTKPQNPKMLGAATDLYTFYFVLTSPAGIDKITRIDESYLRPEPIKGDWADGKDYLLGQNLTQLRITLLSTAKNVSTYEASFMPAPGLQFPTRWMEEPVCEGQPNNHQMIRRQGDGFVPIWGCEQFEIQARVDTVSGKIVSAHMENLLRWKLRYCIDRELEKCNPLPDRQQHRSVDLKLVRQ